MDSRIAVLAIVLGVGILPSSHAAAGAGLSVSPTFPATVTVGQTGIAASITITNNNTPPDVATTVVSPRRLSAGAIARVLRRGGDRADTVLRSAIAFIRHLHRARSRSGRVPDQSDGTGSGACAGITFTTVPLNDVFGNYRFDPPSGVHVVLPTVGSACTISFTFDVLKMPTLDRQAAVPGVQTAQIVIASAQIGRWQLLAAARGRPFRSPLTQAVPSIATDASPDIVLGAGQLSDQATVTGLVNPTGPQTVTFNLYGPADVACAAAPVFTSTVALSAWRRAVGSRSRRRRGHLSVGRDLQRRCEQRVVSGACGDATEVAAVAPADAHDRDAGVAGCRARRGSVVGSGDRDWVW